jgi:hexosaminidase
LNLPLIPKPQKLILRGKPYTLRSGASVFYPKEGERAARILQRLKGFTPAAENADVRFELDQAIEGEEAYSLDIRGDGVRICASSAAGLFYGAQTFRQLLPPAVEKEGLTNNIELPQLHIEDRPRFPHRSPAQDGTSRPSTHTSYRPPSRTRRRSTRQLSWCARHLPRS